MLSPKRACCAAINLLIAGMGIARAQVTVSPPNYTVTTPGSRYKFFINGVSSAQPPQDANVDDSLNFTIAAGATYVFNVNVAIGLHSLNFCTAPKTSAHYNGASDQAVENGTVTLTLPATNYPQTLYYICNNHSFYGIITVAPPQPPPVATILKVRIGTNIVLTFTGGTNTIPLMPQYSSNLSARVWTTVPGYTNIFTGGATNTATFNRLEAICGPRVYLRLAQAPN